MPDSSDSFAEDFAKSFSWGEEPSAPDAADAFAESFAREQGAAFIPQEARAYDPSYGPQQPIAPWSASKQFGRAFTLGATEPARALGRALGLPGHAPVAGETFAQRYGEARAEDVRGREAWEALHQPEALGIDIAGSLPATLGAMAAGQEYAVAPMLERIGAAAPGLARAASAVPGLVTRAASGAAQGLAATGLQAGLQSPSWLYGAGAGAALNTVMGPLAPALSEAESYGARRMSDLNVPVKMGQFRSGPVLTKPYAKVSESQLDSLDSALGRTTGADTGLRWPDLMGPRGRAWQIGAKMENIAGNYDIGPDHADLLYRNLANIQAQAQSDLAGNPAALARVEGHINRIPGYSAWHAAAATGTPFGAVSIPGSTYQSMTRFGSPLGRDIASRTDPNVSHYAGEIKSALDSIWQRALPPDEAAQWGALKQQYKNTMILHGGGKVVNDTTGHVNIPALYNGVLRRYGTTNPAHAGDIGALSQGAKHFFLPNLAEKGGGHTTPLGLAGYGALGIEALRGLGEWTPYVQGMPIVGNIAEHPLVSAATGGVVMGAGALLSRPGVTRALTGPAGHTLQRMPNPLIPPLTLARPAGYNPLYGDQQQ